MSQLVAQSVQVNIGLPYGNPRLQVGTPVGPALMHLLGHPRRRVTPGTQAGIARDLLNFVANLDPGKRAM